ADRRRHAGTRPHDGAIIPAALAEDLGVARAPGFGSGSADGALLRILVRAVAPQRALRAVPDLAPMPDVEQAGDLELAVPERGADADGPVVVRVLYEARIRILQRVAVRVHVQRALRMALTHGAEAVRAATRRGDDIRRTVGNAAPEEAAPEVHADRLAHHGDLVVEVADRDELLRAERQHLVAVPGP